MTIAVLNYQNDTLDIISNVPELDGLNDIEEWLIEKIGYDSDMMFWMRPSHLVRIDANTGITRQESID